MGIPALPKFNTPNLCGASAEMNDMIKKKDELMKKLEEGLEKDASTLKAEMDTGLKELKDKIKKLAPEMPETADKNFQAEIKGLQGISKSTPQGLLLFNAKVTELTKTFGDKLKEVGSDVEKEVAKVDANIKAGGTGCSCGVPNLVVGGDGKVKEKPENPVMPVKEEEKEEKSTVVTPSVSLNQATQDVIGLMNKALPVMSKAMGALTQEVSLNGPSVSPKMLEIARDADMEMKNTIGGSHPGLKRLDNFFGQKHIFNTVDTDKALANPDKSNAQETPSGINGLFAAVNNHVKNVERQAELFSLQDAKNKKTLNPIKMAFKAASRPFPENKANSTEIWYFNSQDDKDTIETNYYRWDQWICDQRRIHEKDLDAARHHENGPENAPRLVASVKEYGEQSETETKKMGDFYESMLKNNLKPIPEEGAPGGSQVQDGGEDAGKKFLMAKHSNIISLGRHRSGRFFVRIIKEGGKTSVHLGPTMASVANTHGNNIPRDSEEARNTPHLGPAAKGKIKPLHTERISRQFSG